MHCCSCSPGLLLLLHVLKKKILQLHTRTSVSAQLFIIPIYLLVYLFRVRFVLTLFITLAALCKMDRAQRRKFLPENSQLKLVCVHKALRRDRGFPLVLTFVFTRTLMLEVLPIIPKELLICFLSEPDKKNMGYCSQFFFLAIH